jgi:hypothetical protein
VSVIVCWLLFPLVLGLVSLGCGLLVGRLAGVRLPGTLLMPLGLAAIVVASQVVTYLGATARLATPLVVAMAVAGYASAFQQRRAAAARVDGFAAAATVGVFLVFGAPVFLSGHSTFLGYTLLGDDSIHFTLIDWVMRHGQQLGHLAPSSYHAVLAGYLGTSYPLGVHTALGSVRPLVGQDVAWVYQPFVAFVAAMSALALYQLLARAIRPAWLAAVAAFLAAMPGLVYAYSLEGSVKEIATVWLLVLVVALCAEWVESRRGVRSVIPLAVTVAAGMAVLNVSILPWLAPVLAAALVVALVAAGRAGWRPLARDTAAFLALTAVLSFPALAVVRSFVQTTNSSLTGGSQVGNLLGPLNDLQAFGIWPSTDFRLPPTGHLTVTHVLIGIEIAAIILGVAYAVWRRRLWPLVLAGASLVGWAYVTARGSPWSDAKALMIASPAAVAMAMVGVGALWALGRRIPALALAALIGFGILWTNVLAYHYANLAPRDRLGELATIGSRFAGQGPTLFNGGDEFAKHFLRATDPSDVGDAWQDPPRATLVTGGGPPFAVTTDIDQLALRYIERFHTLVLRRSGSASRPPSNYRLVRPGRWYDVWQRTPATVVNHFPVGDALQPAAVAPCSSLAVLSRSGPTLHYLERPRLPVLLPAQAQHPRSWLPAGQLLSPHSPGTLSGRLNVPAAGRYTVWLQGTFSRGYRVSVDGRRVGSVSDALNPPEDFESAGQVELSAGPHRLEVVRPQRSLAPGDGAPELLGPIVLAPATAPPIRTLPSSHWHELCGKRLDWAEAVP